MFKKIISNRRVVTITISVLSLFAITMALRKVGLYEGMKNKKDKVDKKEEDEADKKEEEVASGEEFSSMKSTKVAKPFVQE